MAFTISLRAIPVRKDGERVGAIVLCRDVTEVRLQERELLTKDATIREIHHRVKNNLQTVSALLRLQARRTGSEEARDALSDAQKRVAAIAVVVGCWGGDCCDHCGRSAPVWRGAVRATVPQGAG